MQLQLLYNRSSNLSAHARLLYAKARYVCMTSDYNYKFASTSTFVTSSTTCYTNIVQCNETEEIWLASVFEPWQTIETGCFNGKSLAKTWKCSTCIPRTANNIDFAIFLQIKLVVLLEVVLEGVVVYYW